MGYNSSIDVHDGQDDIICGGMNDDCVITTTLAMIAVKVKVKVKVLYEKQTCIRAVCS